MGKQRSQRIQQVLILGTMVFMVFASIQAYGGQAAIKPGDTVTVTAGPAPVKTGDTTLVTVGDGTELTVTEVEGDWIGVTVAKDGQNVPGWIHAKHLSRGTRGPGEPAGREPEKEAPKTNQDPGRPKDPKEVVEAGGKSWQACAEANFLGRTFRPGKLLWIWPVEDKLYAATARLAQSMVGGRMQYQARVPLKLRWALRRPGQPVPSILRSSLLSIHHGNAGNVPGGAAGAFCGRTLTLGNATEGEIELPVVVADALGEVHVIVYVALATSNNSETPVSNLLLLKVNVTK